MDYGLFVLRLETETLPKYYCSNFQFSTSSIKPCFTCMQKRHLEDYDARNWKLRRAIMYVVFKVHKSVEVEHS
jgi:hypothetical protein